MQMNGEKLVIWLEIDLGSAPMTSLDQLMLVVTHPGLAAVISLVSKLICSDNQLYTSTSDSESQRERDCLQP